MLRRKIKPRIHSRVIVECVDRKGVLVTVFGTDGSKGEQYVSHRCNPYKIRDDSWALAFRGKLYPFKKPGLSSQQWAAIEARIDALFPPLTPPQPK